MRLAIDIAWVLLALLAVAGIFCLADSVNEVARAIKKIGRPYYVADKGLLPGQIHELRQR